MNLLNLLAKSFGSLSLYSSSGLLRVLFSSFFLSASFIHAQIELPSLENLNQSSFLLKDSELSQWFAPKDIKVKALALVTHGLNLKPSRMNTIIKSLNAKGVLVLRLALTGHRGSIKEQKEVTLEQWLTQYQQAIDILVKLKEKYHFPLYSLSYSLGSEVHLNTIAQGHTPAFDKSIFFAPATWSYWYTQWPAWAFFLPDHFAIKSFNHSDYRAEASTSMAAYRALDEGKVRWNQFAQKKNFSMLEPFMVVIDPNDELISLEKIKNFRENNPQVKAQLFVLKSFKPSIDPSFHHLIIDKWAVGTKQWQEIEEAIFSYLKL